MEASDIEHEAAPPAAPAAAPPPRRPPPSAAERASKAVRELRDEEEQDIRSWIDSLAGDTPIKVAIIRKKPLIGPNGENTVGTLENIEEKFDEDYLAEVWGGGTYELQIKKQNASGSFQFFRSRTVKIGGPSKINGRVLLPGAPVAGTDARTNEDPGIAGRALDMMERTAKADRERAERLEAEGSRGGLDIAAITQITKPLVDELAEARREIASLQKEVLAQISKPPPKDEFRDRLLERSVEGGDKRMEDMRTLYEGRIAALREQYENRLDKIRDDHEAAIKRLDDKHDREMERLADQHEREIARSEKASEASNKGTEVGYQGRIDALQSENKRLERELLALQTKVATLETIKNKSPNETLKEMVELKENFDALGGGGDDDSNKPWYERLIDAAGNSQAVLDLVAKVGNASGAAPGQQAEPPVGQAFYGPDGGVYVRNPDNSYARVQHPGQPQQIAGRAGKRKRKAAQQAVAAAGTGAGGAIDDGLGDDDDAEPIAPPVKKPSAKEIKAAVAFMENAVKSGADAENFARGVRNLVPGETLQFIQQVGPEAFLGQVVLESGSPLTTQNGRNFVRKVFKTLFEGGED